MVRQFLVDGFDELEEVGDFNGVGRAILLVQLDDDAEANENIFFILVLQEFKRQAEDVLLIGFEEFIGGGAAESSPEQAFVLVEHYIQR